MWRTLGGLLLAGYLPGALIYRLPIAERDRRAALGADERTFWAIVISLTLSLIVTLVMAAARLYAYDRLLLVNFGVSVAAISIGRRRLLFEGTASRLHWCTVVPLVLTVMGLWLYFPSSEYVIGGKDPGTYINEGIQIAQRGALVVADPVVASVPIRLRDLMFPSHHNPLYYGLRFMGFFILDPVTGTVVGQFPHLYPASVAIAYGLNGLSGARQAVGVWGILGLLGVYFTGARLMGRPAAAAAATLLAINVVQVWFARYPNAELVMQALLFAALLATARASIDGDRFFAPIAGTLLALLLFLRYDAVLAIASVGAGMAFGLAERRRPRLSLAGPLAVGLAVWWIYMTTWMKPYSSYPLGFTRSLGPVRLALSAAAAVVVLALLSRSKSLARELRRRLPDVLTVTVIAAATYAYFLRPAGHGTAVHDATALQTFGWYITKLGLLAAMIGFACAARPLFWRDPTLFVTVAVFGGFFFYKIRIVPEHFWMARRFLPVILPGALLFASYAAFRFFDPGAWRRLAGRRRVTRPNPRLVLTLSTVLPVAVLIPLGTAFLQATAPIVQHVEYAGLIPHLEQLARRFGDDDLVLVESRNASDLHVLAVPLAYIYARQVLMLDSPRPDPAQFRDFLRTARERYRDVFFIGGGGTDLLSRSIGVRVVASERFQIPEYASPINRYPTGVRMKEFDFGVYRFVTVPNSPSWFLLDVGTNDDLHVVRFHAKERSGPETFRWTRDVSYVSLVGLGAGARLVTLWLSDGRRPETLDRAHVRLFLDDRPLGETDVGPGFIPYSFGIPADVADQAARREEPARLRLETNTWNPHAALGTPDDRQLGVMVDRVEAR